MSSNYWSCHEEIQYDIKKKLFNNNQQCVIKEITMNST